MSKSKKTVEAYHYGPEGIKEVDPAHHGKGADQRKFMKTGKPQTPVVHAYLGEHHPEEVVTASGGTHKHKIHVDLSKMYDITKDPKGHLLKASHDMAHGNYEGNPVDAQDLARTRIKAEGYHGLHRRHGASPGGSVELFHKTPVMEAKGGKVKDTEPVFTKADTYANLEHNDDQKNLIHGINLRKVSTKDSVGDEGSTGEFTISGRTKNAKGVKAQVKGRISDEDLHRYFPKLHTPSLKEHMKFTTAHREALYHNLANHIGMGNFVPTTSVIHDKKNKTHGKEGDFYSAMKIIPNAEHYEWDNENHETTVNHHYHRGDLHKLAIMNTLFGNTDRHGGNFMISPEGIHMIDHGLTFDFSGGASGRDVFTPRYLQEAHRQKDMDETEDYTNPKAKEWLNSIKSADLLKFFKKNKVPAKISSSIIKGLQAAKDHIESSHGEDTISTVLDAIRRTHGDKKEE